MGKTKENAKKAFIMSEVLIALVLKKYKDKEGYLHVMINNVKKFILEKKFENNFIS